MRSPSWSVSPGSTGTITPVAIPARRSARTAANLTAGWAPEGSSTAERRRSGVGTRNTTSTELRRATPRRSGTSRVTSGEPVTIETCSP